jgi:Flp pilus assembly protein TadD
LISKVCLATLTWLVGLIAWNGSARDIDNSPPRQAISDQHGAAIVSADRLRWPLSNKARRMIEKAQAYSNSGDHDRAIEELTRTLVKDRSARPYLRSILGFEYLQVGRVEEATTELKEAVRLFPNEALNRSNLALSLYAGKQYRQAEQEVMRALELDPDNPKSRVILGLILSKRNLIEP